MPHFVSPGQLRRVKHAVSRLSKVLDRFCDAYPHDAALRDELAVSPEEDSLIRVDPGYPRPMRICRLDAFLAGYDVKFLEFNADSPAGIGYTDILYEGLQHADRPPARPAGVRHRVHADAPRADRHAARRLRARPHPPQRPARSARALALVDVEGSPAVPEFRIVCAAARAAGLRGDARDARRADLRRLDADRRRASPSSSSTAARCSRTSTSPTSSPPPATAASASSTRSARASPTTRSCSRSSTTRASRTSSRATRPT